MYNRRKNNLQLWRKFGATDKQPLAMGAGLVGENDFAIYGSMWPSKKGENANGPWQVWNISLKPAKGETRKLVAVPPQLLGKVLELIGEPSGAGSVPPPSGPAQGGGTQSVAEDDIPF